MNALRRLVCRVFDLVARPPEDAIHLGRHPSLKTGESFALRLPKPGCRHCHGRGILGKMIGDGGAFVPCRCLGVVSWQEKLPYRVHVRQGRVEEVTVVAV